MTETLKLGTRGSPLAVAQSTQVARDLERSHPGLHVTLVRIITTGDHMQTGPVKPVDSTKAVFTKELEDAILNGEVDFAVHSAKDLAAHLPKGLTLAAFPRRAPVEDILISRHALGVVVQRKGLVIASGSVRRSCQWRERWPETRFEPLRGNIDTRIRLLREHEDWDGILLARAGVERLGPELDGLVVTSIPTDWVLPAPGQGALALQIREDDERTAGLLRVLDHPETRAAVECERTFLTAMDAGCSVPLGALAEATGAERFRFRAVFYPDHRAVGEKRFIEGNWVESSQLVEALALSLKDA
jgi:hydroxymethylbilane synthase